MGSWYYWNPFSVRSPLPLLWSLINSSTWSGACRLFPALSFPFSLWFTGVWYGHKWLVNQNKKTYVCVCVCVNRVAEKWMTLSSTWRRKPQMKCRDLTERERRRETRRRRKLSSKLAHAHAHTYTYIDILTLCLIFSVQTLASVLKQISIKKNNNNRKNTWMHCQLNKPGLKLKQYKFMMYKSVHPFTLMLLLLALFI